MKNPHIRLDITWCSQNCYVCILKMILITTSYQGITEWCWETFLFWSKGSRPHNSNSPSHNHKPLPSPLNEGRIDSRFRKQLQETLQAGKLPNSTDVRRYISVGEIPRKCDSIRHKRRTINYSTQSTFWRFIKYNFNVPIRKNGISFYNIQKISSFTTEDLSRP